MSADSDPTRKQDAPQKKEGKAPQQKDKKQDLSQESALTFSTVFGILIFLLILVALPVLWMRGLGLLAFAETALREWFYLLIGILLPLILGLIYWAKADQRKLKLPLKQREKDPIARRFLRIGALTASLSLLGGAYAFTVHPYLVAKSYTAGSQTSEETTSFADRAPWIVANNYAQRDQGDVIGDRGDVHYVPAPQDAKAAAGDGTGQGTSRYTVLVKERGVMGTGGYSAIQTLTMPTTGTIPADASSYCEIPDAMGKRLETVWPWYSLNWSIYAKAPFAHYNREDAYGYCDQQGKPIIVVPLWAYEGFWNVTKKPNGAAIYTEQGLEILSPSQLQEAKIEGPTYPRSLASTQRESINAGGSLIQWWGSKYGYDLTDADSEDANSENPSEFTLVSPADASLSYVSPLTPRGSSQSITAVSVVPAQQTSGERATLVVNTSTDLPSTSTLVTSIKESSVAGDNAWTTRWSAGMRVYEVLPAGKGHWAASIGQGQAVSYRADISPDGRVTVVNAETGQSSQGAGQGTSARESVTVDAGKPLSQMTEAELLNLIQQATTELQKRQG